MQNNLFKIPIVLYDNWPWPSKSNWTPKSKFSPFWACPCHNLPPIELTVSKFGTKMHLSTMQIPTNFGLDWNWSSIQFLISNPGQLSFLCTSLAFFSETSWFESWENWKNSEGVNQFKEQPLEQLLRIDCFTVRMFHGGSYWVCHWKKTFRVVGCDGIGGLAYLLFCAAYWSRQPRVFRRLSRSCKYLTS